MSDNERSDDTRPDDALPGDRPESRPDSRMEQIWLLNYKNPLLEKLGVEFFRSIPKRPGVYWMIGRDGQILYVGKAKCLRERLRSYCRAKPDQVARKVLRLVTILTEIRWEICATERDALLRENFLLRQLRPPFNTLNTYPETYLFLGFDPRPEGLRIKLAHSLPSDSVLREDLQNFSSTEEFYGAFKGRGLIRRGYASLLRLLWASLCGRNLPRFDYPSVLARRRVPEEYLISVRALEAKERLSWERAVRRFLKGTSQKLLEKLTLQLLEIPNIPPFLYTWIQEDIQTLQSFYVFGPHRNLTLRRFHKISGNLIQQNEMDDLLVSFQCPPEGPEELQEEELHEGETSAERG